MLFRNTRTGAVIESDAMIAGKNWERADVKSASPAAPAKDAEKTERKPSGRRKK